MEIRPPGPLPPFVGQLFASRKGRDSRRLLPRPATIARSPWNQRGPRSVDRYRHAVARYVLGGHAEPVRSGLLGLAPSAGRVIMCADTLDRAEDRPGVAFWGGALTTGARWPSIRTAARFSISAGQWAQSRASRSRRLHRPRCPPRSEAAYPRSASANPRLWNNGRH